MPRRSLEVRLAGNRWLKKLASYGPVTISHEWPHGSEQASWDMNPDFRHPLLKGGTLVEVFSGGVCIWRGFLIEPKSDGRISALGLWYEAHTAPLLDSSNVGTLIPTTAVFGARFRGDVRWGQPAGSGLSTTPWSTQPALDITMADFLDQYTASNAQRWWINPLTGDIEVKVDPTVHQWVVPNAVAGMGLTPAEDTFYSHLVGVYYNTGGDVAWTAPVGSADAAAAFRRRTHIVDLRELGNISQATAEADLANRFLLVGARMGWAETLQLSHGQIFTAGGVPAPLGMVRAGQMVRLAGVFDMSRANKVAGSTDIVIAGSTYTDGEPTISLRPLGKAVRNMDDLLRVAAGGGYAA
jgi:hypothetical protein